MSTAKGTKRGHDYGRDPIDPLDICIIGGKSLPPDEQGPLDTDDGPDHIFYGEADGLTTALTETFINNVDALGVDTPPVVCRYGNLLIALAGRTRFRAARVVNRRRAKRGEPLITIRVVVKRGTETQLMATMIAENAARKETSVLGRIDQCIRYMGRGVSAKDAGIVFNVEEATVKGWLMFHDNAIDATKNAARSGRISQTAAATLARIKDPVKQQAALDDMLTSAAGGRTSRRAAQLAAKGQSGSKVTGITDKKTQRRFLAAVQAAPHPNASEKTLAFWEGVEEALKIVVGDDGADSRVKGLLDQTYALMKTERRAAEKKRAEREDKRRRRAEEKTASTDDDTEDDDDDDDDGAVVEDNTESTEHAPA